jgi:hypothetical protein
MDGALTTVEQRDKTVRLYARVTKNHLTGAAAPQASPVRAPAAGTVSRSKVAEVRAGMDRAAVEAALGKPNSVMAIQGLDDPTETLIYNLEDQGTARVRTVNGNVASVTFSE